MNMFRVIAILALLAASRANAAEPPETPQRHSRAGGNPSLTSEQVVIWVPSPAGPAPRRRSPAFGLASTARFRLNGFARGRPLVQLAEAGRKHRDGWTKFCFYASNAEPEVSGRTAKQPAIEVISEVCYTYAELRDQPTGTNFGILGVLQYKTPDRILIVALLRHPLYQALPDNPGYIRLDGTVRVQLRYLAHDTCDYAGCYVRAEMRQSSLDRMKTAKAISFGFWDATGRVLSASLPSSGFGAALDGVPVPLEEQDETQRKILEIMRRRFADIAR